MRSICNGCALPARVVVVDQGSNPDVEHWLQRLTSNGVEVRRVVVTAKGAGAARNRGIEQTVTRFIAAVDDDCTVGGNWLQTIREMLESAPEAIVTGKVVPEGDEPVPSTIISDQPRRYVRPLIDRDPLFSGNMGFARATYDHVGAFDERACVKYAEDAEWSYRALRSEVPIVYAPSAEVTHHDRREAAARALTYRRYARSQGGFYGMYLRAGDRFICVRALHDVLRGPWIVARAVATGDHELLSIGRAYVTQLVPGLVAGFRAGRL